MTLKIGVIGTGAMGKNHARVCAELPNVELVGIADTDKNTVQMIAKRFDVASFTDYTMLIPLTDAVIIATPTVTHFNIALDAIHNGKHILVEKPVCDTVDKGKELIEKADDEGLIFAVGHIERHNPVVSFMKQALDNGQFGELITLGSKRVSNFPGRIRDVGVIFDFGVHDIDVMRYLAGEVTSVYAKAGRFNKKIQYEDHATIMINFTNGLCGVVEVNWLTPMKIRKLILTCDTSSVEADFINQSVQTSTSSFEKIDTDNLYDLSLQHQMKIMELQKKEPLKNEISDFANAINKNKKPLVTGYDGVKAVEIAEAAVQSSKTGKVIGIDS
ncbi:MAG: Gfo/Idh/MocA family oxidoreductase [Candidatus Thermoplasmatota archaeon]|nr:Gfo/Idh/MocA family oxidoreductase [Candidatus Thermoplasmatota archaeon]